MVGLVVELRSTHGWPTALGADAVTQGLVVGPQLLACLRVGLGHVAGRVDADRLDGSLQLSEGALIEIDVRDEALGIAADDGQHHRQVISRGADHRLRAAADADPGLEWLVALAWEDLLVDQGSAGSALPGHGPLADQRREEIELLLEQLVVLRKLEAEEREGLGEGPAAQDYLGAAVRGRVQGRVALEDADRVVGTQHRDGRAELDARRQTRDRRQHHFGR